MKKLTVLLAAILVLFMSVSLAEDLSSLSDEKLTELYHDVLAEMEKRNLVPEREETPDTENAAALDRLSTFFFHWSGNRLDDMLPLCSDEWKAGVENTRTALFALLANRTPLSMECAEGDIHGNPGDSVLTIDVTSEMDRHNGKPAEKYRLRIVMQKQADGLWYVDPRSLQTYELFEVQTTPEPEPTKEPAMVPGDTLLYYNPTGGEYYHLDQNCKRVHERFRPLEGSFTYSQLGEEPYCSLKPCQICGAPERSGNPMQFATFGDALDAPSESLSWGADSKHCIALITADGKFYRVVADSDEKAGELNHTAQEADENKWQEAWDALEKYVRTLPVSYTEEITAVPAGQEELDALAGKKLEELDPEVWTYYPFYGSEEEGKASFILIQGMYRYEAEISDPYDVYLEHERDYSFGGLTIKSVKLIGLSSKAHDLRFRADGTWVPEEEPMENYELMMVIADELAAVWEKGEPDAEGKEALIRELTEKYPEGENMIREMVETFTIGEREE